MQYSAKQPQQGFFNAKDTFFEVPRENFCNNQYRSNQYYPFHLRNHVTLKLLPQQIYQKIGNIPEICSNNEDQQQNSRDMNQIFKQTFFPYELYSEESYKYQLLYSKYEGEQFKMVYQNFAERKIKINKIDPLQQNNYVALKNLDINDRIQNSTLTINFDSRFQCGNLLCVYSSQVKQNQFDCYIENDTNTYGYNNHFYFSVSGLRISNKYIFRIMNFKKKHSFFEKGKKVILFSMNKHKKTGNGWSRVGSRIIYQRSSIRDQIQGQNIKLYCLSFQYQPQSDNDFLTFSSTIPYSYSKLIRRIQQFGVIAKENNIQWQLSTIAYSLSNNKVPYLKIFKRMATSSLISKAKQQLQSIRYQKNIKCGKPIIVILARQHPGQTNSSFLMEEVLYSLACSSNSSIQNLLEDFQFRIFPMVNVDGVIYGNYRCDIAGFDLNRTWNNPDKYLQPQIWAIKQQIKNINRNHQILGCFDLHSHSSKMNVFAYCCNSPSIQCQLFTFIFSKISPFFNFQSCTFGLSVDKRNTARSFFFEISKNNLVATIECSSFAFEQNQKASTLLPLHFTQISADFLQSLQIVLSKSKQRQLFLNELRDMTLEDNLVFSNKNQEQQISGSDSEPEADQIDLSQRLSSVLSNYTILSKSYQNKKNPQSNCFCNSSLYKQPNQIKRVSSNNSIPFINKKQLLVVSSNQIKPNKQHEINLDIFFPKKALTKQTNTRASKSINKIQFCNTLQKSREKQPTEEEQHSQIKINLAKSNCLDSQILKKGGRKNESSIKNSIMSSYLLSRNYKQQRQIFETPIQLLSLNEKIKIKNKKPIFQYVNRNRCLTSFRNAIITEDSDIDSNINQIIEKVNGTQSRYRSLDNNIHGSRIEKLILSQAKHQVAQSRIRENIRQNLICLRKTSYKKRKKPSPHNLLMVKGNYKPNKFIQFPSIQ